MYNNYEGVDMKLKILIMVLILLIIGLVIFIYDKKSSKELELTYKISAGIPYKWVYKIDDESIVKFVKSYVLKDENKGGMTGAKVYTNYVFKGLKEGITSITFKCVSIEDDSVSEEEINRVQVDKEGNISLLVDANEK